MCFPRRRFGTKGFQVPRTSPALITNAVDFCIPSRAFQAIINCEGVVAGGEDLLHLSPGGHHDKTWRTHAYPRCCRRRKYQRSFRTASLESHACGDERSSARADEVSVARQEASEVQAQINLGDRATMCRVIDSEDKVSGRAERRHSCGQPATSAGDYLKTSASPDLGPSPPHGKQGDFRRRD